MMMGITHAPRNASSSMIARMMNANSSFTRPSSAPEVQEPPAPSLAPEAISEPFTAEEPTVHLPESETKDETNVSMPKDEEDDQ
jgi:hypothetical protein